MVQKVSDPPGLPPEAKCEKEACLLAFAVNSDPMSLESSIVSARIRADIFGVLEEEEPERSQNI